MTPISTPGLTRAASAPGAPAPRTPAIRGEAALLFAGLADWPPELGEFTLTYEVRYLADGQRMTVYQAEPDSRDHDALTLLSVVERRRARERRPVAGRPCERVSEHAFAAAGIQLR